MATATERRRITVANIAPIADAIDATITKAPAPVTLANANGEVQADAIIRACVAPYLRIAAAALMETKGNGETAAALVGDAVRPSIVLIVAIVPILRNTAPAALFVDRNNRGARVGELFASKLGLSALYRETSRASLKDARAALVEIAR